MLHAPPPLNWLFNACSDSGDDSASGDDAAATIARLRQQRVVAAPAVATGGLVLEGGAAVPVSECEAAVSAPSIDTRTLRHNPTVGELYGGARGDAAAVREALRNHTAGHVEDCGLPSAVFEEQYNAFHAFGRAEAPDGRAFTASAVGGGAHSMPQCLLCLP